MTTPKYATRQHREERKKWARIIASGQGWCAEAVCLMPSRFIAPGQSWDLAHDVTGTRYLGPAHPACNRSEGASRGNRMRGRRLNSRRWPL